MSESKEIEYDAALNDAALAFLEALPSRDAYDAVFNHVKPALKAGIEKWLNGQPDLSAAILNIPAKCPIPGINALLAYKMGHKDARHAAAELILKKTA